MPELTGPYLVSEAADGDPSGGPTCVRLYGFDEDGRQTAMADFDQSPDGWYDAQRVAYLLQRDENERGRAEADKRLADLIEERVGRLVKRQLVQVHPFTVAGILSLAAAAFWLGCLFTAGLVQPWYVATIGLLLVVCLVYAAVHAHAEGVVCGVDFHDVLLGVLEDDFFGQDVTQASPEEVAPHA